MKVKADTIARTIVLALALFNQALAIMGKGKLDIAENDIYQVVTLAVTIYASVRAWWKNNSFSDFAIRADEFLAEIKTETGLEDGEEV